MNTKYPTIKESLLLLFIITALMLLFGMIIGIIEAAFNLYNLNTFFIGIVNLIAIGIFLIKALKKTKSSFNELYPFESFKVILLLPIMSTAIGLNIILSEIDNITRFIFPMPTFWIKAFTDIIYSPNTFSSFFVLCIIAPLTEELLFRGLILQSFLNQYSKKKSIITSSLLFAVFHLNPWQFISTFIAGILLSILFINQRSLFSCFVAHSFYNFIPIFLIRIINININGYSTVPSEILFQPFWFNFIGFLFLICGLILSFQLLNEKNKQET